MRYEKAYNTYNGPAPVRTKKEVYQHADDWRKNCGVAQEKRDDTGGAGVAARHIGTVGFQMGNRSFQ